MVSKHFFEVPKGIAYLQQHAFPGRLAKKLRHEDLIMVSFDDRPKVAQGVRDTGFASDGYLISICSADTIDEVVQIS